MTRLLLFLLFSLLLPLSGAAQGENNNWCYGYNIGLNFNTSPPTFFNSNLHVKEGSTSVSDASGNLLFYSAGHTIWDRNGNVMPNGSGMSGNGPVQNGVPVGSSKGGAIAIKSVANPNQYYCFSMGAVEDGPPGLWYSVVDMSLNGGLGDVVAGEKNIFLMADLSEYLATTVGGDCNSYWLVVRSSYNQSTQNYLAFKVDANGVSATPVISPANTYTTGMIFSKDGKKLYAADFARLAISDFNNTTGVVSSPVYIYPPQGQGIFGNLALSPDGQKLYIAIPVTFTGYVLQYDLSLLPNTTAVENSRVQLDTAGYFDIKTGPDGKVYLLNAHMQNSVFYMSAIENPNVAGTGCNLNRYYIPQTVLPPNSYTYMLFSNSIAINPPMDTVSRSMKDTVICFADSMRLTLPEADQYLWGNGSASQSITVHGNGTYTAHSLKGCRTYADTFRVRFEQFGIDLGADTALCPDAAFLLAATEVAGAGYRWQNGSTGNSISIDEPGQYFVTVTKNGCTASDTLEVGEIDPYLHIRPEDSSFCRGNAVTITANAFPESIYTWSTGATGNSITVSQAGVYRVQAVNVCGAFSDSSVIKLTECQCEVLAPNAFSPNGDGRNDQYRIMMDCPELEQFSLAIYNRWGQRVFYTTDPEGSWDGTYSGQEATVGAYYFYLKYKHARTGDQVRKGDIILVR